MYNKIAKGEMETIVSIIVFISIILIFAFGGVFSAIFQTFNTPVFGGYGTLLGILFILIIVVTLFERVLGK